MSYRNKNTGYPGDILQTRSIIKKNNYALIDVNGIVKNVVPGFENCEMTILGSPKLGASFVDYVCTMLKDGKNELGFGGDGVETFAYVIEGEVEASDGETTYHLSDGSYLYVPADKKMYLKNVKDGNSELFLYKRRYRKLDGYEATTISNNVSNLENIKLDGMDDVELFDLLPTHLGFDMNMHILSFYQGACHPYIETHVQEHGALVLAGEGMYNLDNTWVPVKKGDYIFMAAYSPQAGYGIGREKKFTYIYSKDCNRDEEI